MAAPVLLFVPVDDRPVTMEMVADLGRAAGVDVRVPDRSILGDRFRAGDADKVWEWLEREAAGGAAALIASAEMLCFGGLVASRKSQATFEEVMPRVRRLDALASRIPTYVSAVIPRTPSEPTDEDAPYWTTGDSAAMRRHRSRHRQLNAALLSAASRGVFRYLLIGQDDTAPGSPSQADRETLQEQARTAAASNVLLTSGTDELNARLLARWLNDLTGAPPSVRILYTYPEATEHVPRYEAVPLHQTVDEHVRSAGASITASPDADILLWVHNFDGQQQEARDQPGTIDAGKVSAVLREVRDTVRVERVVALADVRFANGADRALVTQLLAEPRFFGVVAYAGWNTCSNSLGSAVAQAIVAHHLRAFTVPGNDRIYRPTFFTRLLDDWGYQAVVRPSLGRWLAERGGDAAQLSTFEAAAETFAAERLRTEALPPLRQSFRYQPVELRHVAFPWHRLFEARLELEVASAERGRNIVVVEYDPRWPQKYEEDKAAILRAVGPHVRGIEHIGSTSVPGLVAKPVVDIMLGVDRDDLDNVIEPLAGIGYDYNPDWEFSMPMRRYFRRLLPDGAHTHHLHVVPHGGAFWIRHLRFRDYLRAHPEKAREYSDLKKRLTVERQRSIDYTFAKTEFIRSVEAQAGVVHPGSRGRTR